MLDLLVLESLTTFPFNKYSSLMTDRIRNIFLYTYRFALLSVELHWRGTEVTNRDENHALDF